MQFNYCQSCFKKTPQTVDIVKFCVHCGKPFAEIGDSSTYNHEDSAVNIAKRISTHSDKALEKLNNDKGFRRFLLNTPKNKRILEDSSNDTDEEIDDIDIDENISVPHISKLQVEIDSDQQNGIPLSNLAKGAARQPKQKPAKQAKTDKKKFLAEFQKSASTLRNQ